MQFQKLRYTTYPAKINAINRILTLLPFDFNARCYEGKTAFWMACGSQNTTFVEILSSLPEIDLNIEDNLGYSPFHYAMRIQNDPVINFLSHLEDIEWSSVQNKYRREE